MLMGRDSEGLSEGGMIDLLGGMHYCRRLGRRTMAREQDFRNEALGHVAAARVLDLLGKGEDNCPARTLDNPGSHQVQSRHVDLQYLVLAL
jgi:hypothetical protein